MLAKAPNGVFMALDESENIMRIQCTSFHIYFSDKQVSQLPLSSHSALILNLCIFSAKFLDA